MAVAGLPPDVLRALGDSRIVEVATDTVSAPAERWAAVLEVAAEQLAATASDPQSWSEEVRSRVVERLGRVGRMTAAAKAPVLLAQERAGAWRKPGMRSFEAHLAAQSREDVATTRREMSTARTLGELEGGLEALARGEITPSHAQRLRPVVDQMDPQDRALLLTDEGAAKVRELAREHDPAQFGRKVEQLAASRRPDQVQDAHEAIRARRHLRIMPGPRGTRIEGLLDPVAGHRFQLAIEAASPRPGADDTRTLGQRNADALEAIAATILDEGRLAPAPNVPTQVMITMTHETFLAAQEHLNAGTHRRRATSPDKTDARPASTLRDGKRLGGANPQVQSGGARRVPGQDHEPPPFGFPQVRAQDGPLLPPADLAKLLCGSAVGRLVVNAQSVPLNAGRTQRTFKNTLRRAVELRDQHCAWPDCHQVARYCKVHHLDWWDSDCGETDVARGVLVCEFHHHELHTHDLELVPLPRDDGGTPLPGDTDYRPPQYELVPRTATADERRQRLAQRMRRAREERRAERRAS